MTLDEINRMNNEELLDTYSLLVRANHYDPFETPTKVKDLYDSNISEDMLWRLIVDRMRA